MLFYLVLTRSDSMVLPDESDPIEETSFLLSLALRPEKFVSTLFKKLRFSIFSTSRYRSELCDAYQLQNSLAQQSGSITLGWL